MSFQLKQLNDESLYEHVFARYVALENNVELLKQDLGIHDRSQTQLEINIEPRKENGIDDSSKRKLGKTRGKRKKSNKDSRDIFNLVIDQSLTSLNSTRDNNNSTTGYVVWSITPFFINWLLYNVEAEPFRSGEKVSTIDAENEHVFMPAMINNGTNEKGKIGIIELGSGVCGILPIVLSNYVDQYVVSDQKGIISKLKSNIELNLSQMSKRQLNCSQLTIETEKAVVPVNDELSVSKNRRQCQLDIIALDWELFALNDKTLQTLYPSLQTLQINQTIYIIAMDVIYNEYLIDSFLHTVSQLYEHYRAIPDINVHFMMGLQLRSQEVLTLFLEKAVIDLELPLCVVESPTWQNSRYALYCL